MLNIIFKRFFTNINESAVKTSADIKNKQLDNKNIIDILKFIPNQKILFYILILIIFFIIFINLKINNNIILGLIVGSILIYFLIQNDHNNKLSIFKDNIEKINFLTTIMYEYEDYLIYFIDKDNVFANFSILKKFVINNNPIIIDFFYSIRNFYLQCPRNYVATLYQINALSKLLIDIKTGVENPFQTLENGIFFYKEAMNSFESLIHGSSQIENKDFKNLTKQIQIVLLNMIKEMKDICLENNNTNELNINSIPDNNIKLIDVISPNDTNSMDYLPNYNYF